MPGASAETSVAALKKPNFHLMDLGYRSYPTAQVTDGHVPPAEVVTHG